MRVLGRDDGTKVSILSHLRGSSSVDAGHVEGMHIIVIVHVVGGDGHDQRHHDARFFVA